MKIKLKKERGTTLIELLVTIVVFTILMGVFLMAFLPAEGDELRISDRLGNIKTAGYIVQNALYQVNAAQPLGACASDALSAPTQNVGGAVSNSNITYSFSTPAQQCRQITTTGTPFYGIANNGVCFYSFPSNHPTTSNSAPNLECLYTANSVLYLAKWLPVSGSTYTTCNPVNCYGQGGSSLLAGYGNVPSQNPASCTKGCPQTYFNLGKLLNDPAPFTFINPATSQQVVPSVSDISSGNLAVSIHIHAENDNQSNWLGPQVYNVNFYGTPEGGINATSASWDSQTG